MGSCHNNTECSARPGLQRQPRLRGAAPPTASCGTGKICDGSGARDLRDRRLPRQQRLQQRPGLRQQHLRGLHGGQPVRDGPALSVGRLRDGQLPRRQPTAPPARSAPTTTAPRAPRTASASSGYGADHLCNGSGACIAGNCRAAGQCTATNQVCNTTSLLCERVHRRRPVRDRIQQHPHLHQQRLRRRQLPHDRGELHLGRPGLQPRQPRVRGLHARSQCSDAANYGPNHICQNNACITGNCHAAADCNNPAQICNEQHLRHVHHERAVHRRLRREPRLLGRRMRLGQLQQLAGVRQQPAVLEPQLHGLHQPTRSAWPTRPTGRCASASAPAATRSAWPATATTRRASARRRPDLRHHHAARLRRLRRLGHRLPGRHATYGSGDHLPGQPSASTGDCHDTSTDCAAGKLCGVSTAHTCGACAHRRASAPATPATAPATSATRATARSATATPSATTAAAATRDASAA